MKRLFLLTIAAVVPLQAVSPQERPDALGRYREGDFEQAVEICLEEIEVTPRSRDSYSVLGWSLIALKRYDEALQELSQLQAINPNDPSLVERRGRAQTRRLAVPDEYDSQVHVKYG